MKSKTCCFNLTLYKKNITHFLPIWLLFFAYLLIELPVGIWTDLMSYLSWDYTVKEAQYYALSQALSTGISATPLFVAAVIAAMAMFSYLYTPKAANMFHALPVNRRELFVTNYISGLLNLIIPELLAFVAGVFVCLGNQITCIQYLFWWLLAVVAITFFAYSMAVFVAMITGQIFAVPIYFIVANFLYVGIRYILSLMLNLICYGIEEGWRPGYSGMLSPWYFLERHLSISTKYDSSHEWCIGLAFEGERYLIIYAVVAIGFILTAWLLYRKRQMETVGDVISVAWVQPIFRWGIALAGGSIFAVFVTNMLREVKDVPVFTCVIICVVIFGFLFFFIAEMFLRKTFKVLKGKRVVEWAVFTVLAITFFSAFRFDLFGIEKRIPDAQEIQMAFLYLDYPVKYTQEDVEELLEIHEELLEKKNEFRQISSNQASYVVIKYYLKDGDVMMRRYPIPLNEETVYDKEGVLADIVKIQQKDENIISDLFCTTYKTNQYMSGYVELYDQKMNVSTVALDAEQATQIAEAIIQDIREGNLSNIVNNYDMKNAPRDYCNGVSLSIFNKEKILSTSDYFFEYWYYSSEENLMATSKEVYLNFNEDCTNTIQTMEEMGILTDDWNLRFYDEYDEYEKDVSIDEEVYLQEDIYIKDSDF